MYSRITPPLGNLRWVHVYSWLTAIALGTMAIAAEPHDATTKKATPLVTSKKGEQLIKALATINKAPRLLKPSEFKVPVFPTEFDWKEYARVRAAIADLVAKSEEEWASVVEHMTDPEYCFTVEAYNSAYNYSRGYVCFVIAQSWVNRGYHGLMPMDPPHYQYQAPYSMDSESLQKWCRIRRDKKLYEIQIEAAEWAISIIPKESKMPKELQDKAIVAIQDRIAKLRETHKPIPGKFFVTDVICPYAEEMSRHLNGKGKTNNSDSTDEETKKN